MLNKKINIKAGHLDVIYQTSKILSKNPSFTESLKEILRVLYAYLNIEASFIALYDENIKNFNIKESFGFTKFDNINHLIKHSSNVIETIFKNDLPIVIYDLKEHKKYLGKFSLENKFKNDNIVFIGIPIKIAGEKFGVLCVYQEKAKNFSHNDTIEMLSIIGTLIGLTKKMHQRIEEERQTWQEEKNIILDKIDKDGALRSIIGISDNMVRIKKLIRRIASLDSTVLLTGESGTGKTMIANAMHNQSSRKNNPFVTISCAAIPENLLESELFGYEKGAFTSAISKKKGKFELANKGTIFLDEIGDMALALQAKLLNVIQDKEISRLGSETTLPIDVRIIVATNKDLTKLMRKNLFREDLYYRLNIIPIHIPPLRERKEDIPLLIDYFKDQLSKQYSKSVTFTNDTIKYLINYDWPGNIRELQNTIERLIIMNDNIIKKEHLPLYIKDNLRYHEKPVFDSTNDIPSKIELLEIENIEKALEISGYVKSKAAKILGYSIRQLDYRILKYGIKVKKF